jgi:hypothetical protein
MDGFALFVLTFLALYALGEYGRGVDIHLNAFQSKKRMASDPGISAPQKLIAQAQSQKNGHPGSLSRRPNVRAHKRNHGVPDSGN